MAIRATASSGFSLPALLVRRVAGRGGLAVWEWYACIFGHSTISLLAPQAFVGVLCMVMPTIQTATLFMALTFLTIKAKLIGTS